MLVRTRTGTINILKIVEVVVGVVGGWSGRDGEVEGDTLPRSTCPVSWIFYFDAGFNSWVASFIFMFLYI